MENANFKEKVSYLEICNLDFAFCIKEQIPFSFTSGPPDFQPF